MIMMAEAFSVTIAKVKAKAITEVLNDEEMVEWKEIMERWRKKKLCVNHCRQTVVEKQKSVQIMMNYFCELIGFEN